MYSTVQISKTKLFSFLCVCKWTVEVTVIYLKSCQGKVFRGRTDGTVRYLSGKGFKKSRIPFNRYKGFIHNFLVPVFINKCTKGSSGTLC